MTEQETMSTLERRLRKFLSLQETYEFNLPGLGLHPRLHSFNEETRTVELIYEGKPWMANPLDRVHGGIVAVLMDTTMGITIHCLWNGNNPTISMNLNYMRPVPLNTDIVVRARVISAGSTVTHAVSEVFTLDQPDRILATATGVFSTKR